jgi:hypothetical protein
MHVKMGNGFPSVAAVIYNEPVAALCDLKDAGYFCSA